MRFAVTSLSAVSTSRWTQGDVTLSGVITSTSHWRPFIPSLIFFTKLSEVMPR